MASDMNEDVIYETLIRVPTKSLIKFKLVSKDLLSLISSAQFRRLHTLHHPKPPPSLLLQPRTASNFFYFNYKNRKLIPYTFDDIPNPKIINSCNGLVLVRSDHDHDHDHEKRYYVFNPTTKQSREIVATRNDDDEFSEIAGMNLAFDPSKSLHYKIACVKRLPSSDQHRVEVYDSASHAWVQNSEPFTARDDSDFNFGIYCNGKIHWKLPIANGFYYDVSTNAVKSLPPVERPRRAEGGAAACMIGHYQEFNGRVHHFATVGASSIVIYELEEDCSRWSVKYAFEFREEFYNYGMMSLTEGEDGAARILVDHSPGKITAFKFDDESCEEVADVSGQAFYKAEILAQFDAARGVHPFVESLAPV